MTTPAAETRADPTAQTASGPGSETPANEPAPRFTEDGSAALEAHLSATCGRIAAGIRGLVPASRLQALLLGGGYGRGQGGVCRTSVEDRPYNDLEFYVFIRGSRHWNEWRYGRAIHTLGEILTPQAGVDVEFRIASLVELAASPVTMFSYDLVAGHRRLIGAESALAHCAHHAVPGEIPLTEATRLLMNRATGLLFARARLVRHGFSGEDSDFVARNMAKAQLAVGDVMLVAHRLYHWNVRERHRRLQRLADAEPADGFTDIVRHHAAGLEFKLHPFRSTAGPAELMVQHAEISSMAREAWLGLEQRRLGIAFDSPLAYAESDLPKWPDTRSARNALVNLRLFGLREATTGPLRRHPRERILNALPVLLWVPEALTSPVLLRRLQRELHSPATDLSGIVEAYRKIWRQVN